LRLASSQFTWRKKFASPSRYSALRKVNALFGLPAGVAGHSIFPAIWLGGNRQRRITLAVEESARFLIALLRLCNKHLMFCRSGDDFSGWRREIGGGIRHTAAQRNRHNDWQNALRGEYPRTGNGRRPLDCHFRDQLFSRVSPEELH
jgi:hypothetical protein